jgi:hypothetical protein
VLLSLERRGIPSRFPREWGPRVERTPYPTFGPFCLPRVAKVPKQACQPIGQCVGSGGGILRGGAGVSPPRSATVAPMNIVQIDDILAALIMSLAMFRRLDVRTAGPGENRTVNEAEFQRWRSLALRAYNQIALASAAKVVLSVGWFTVGLKLGVPAPWFQLGGFVVFLAWALALIWAWKIATDARYLRVQLGIVLRRRSATQS